MRPLILPVLLVAGCPRPPADDVPSDSDDTDLPVDSEPRPVDSAAPVDSDTAVLDECGDLGVGTSVPVRVLALLPAGIPLDTGSGEGWPDVDRTVWVVRDVAAYGELSEAVGFELPPVDFGRATVVAVREHDSSSCGEHWVTRAEAWQSLHEVAVRVRVHDGTWDCCVQCDSETSVVVVLSVPVAAEPRVCVEHVGGCRVDDTTDTSTCLL